MFGGFFVAIRIFLSKKEKSTMPGSSLNNSNDEYKFDDKNCVT